MKTSRTQVPGQQPATRPQRIKDQPSTVTVTYKSSHVHKRSPAAVISLYSSTYGCRGEAQNLGYNAHRGPHGRRPSGKSFAFFNVSGSTSVYGNFTVGVGGEGAFGWDYLLPTWEVFMGSRWWSPCWDTMCCWREDLRPNPRWHISHTKDLL